MPAPLILEKSYNSPEIIFDKENNKFEIGGKSMPEDPTSFYKPVIEWASEYVKDPNPVSELVFKLEYFNSTSARKIVQIIHEFEKIAATGNQVTTIWYYEDGDDFMFERGEEIKGIIKLPFEIKLLE